MTATQQLVQKWQRQLPENLRRGQVLGMARKLGLGQRATTMWLAHDCLRFPVGEQFRYPRDYVIAHLLDKAGLLSQAGVSSLGKEGISEGVPGSTIQVNLR